MTAIESGDSTVLWCDIWHQVVKIKAIKQPVQLLTAENDYLTFKVFWPVELFLLKSFVIKTKTIIFPEQTFDFVSTAVGKCIQTAIEHIVAQFHLDNRRKTPVAFSEIHRIPV